MRMFEVVPTFAAAGVPDSFPVVVLKVAHAGLFVIDQVSVSLFGSVAVGWNEYAVPTCTLVEGVPEIVGAPFGGAVTWIENGARAVVVFPSLTLMRILVEVPTLLVVGVPDS